MLIIPKLSDETQIPAAIYFKILYFAGLRWITTVCVLNRNPDPAQYATDANRVIIFERKLRN